jgi:hypothetical protein
MLGLLRQYQAMEAWAAAGKLGLLRALIRDDDQPQPGGGYRGDLPEGWTKSLTHEVALTLAMPAVSADRLMWLAWDLQARLPGIGELLAAGTLTAAKAKAVNEALEVLSDENAAKAAELILADLPGKTYGQAVKLATQAAVTVDPASAAARREDAERNKCRVQLFREESGAAALSGRDLPTDQTLAAHASVCARAEEYKTSAAFPEDTRMDQYRAAAYLDLLNAISAAARITSGQLVTVAGADAGNGQGSSHAEPVPDPEWPGDDGPDASGPDAPGPHPGPHRGPHPGGPGSAPHGGSPSGGSPPGGPSGLHSGPSDAPGEHPEPPQPPRLTDLVLPLATLLGLADRPGEGHALGLLDPDLCRALAAAAAHSPGTRVCVTVTDPDGIAVGHGCARLARGAPQKRRSPGALALPALALPAPGLTAPGLTAPGLTAAVTPAVPLPAWVNLTVRATELAQLAELTCRAPPAGQRDRPRWSFTRASDPGPPGEHGTWLHGTWLLGLPYGPALVVRLEAVPTFGCDHQHESHAYQPNDTLRHLVQIRDGECTFPSCSRHARESDFEHATPFHRGGRTCACNAGARSRACHRVKQSPGWNVTQPRPGWHHWQTPSGRSYTQGPKRYPA